MGAGSVRFFGELMLLLVLALLPSSLAIDNQTDDIEITADGELIPQIPKCCEIGESLELNADCTKTDLKFDPVFYETNTSKAPTKVDLLIGHTCKYGRYRLEPKKDSMDEFRLLPSGYLQIPFVSDELLSPQDFCLESFIDEEDGSVEVLPLICFPPPPPSDPWKDIAFILYPIGCLISVPFLLITVAIYCLIEDLRDIRGKVLSCYSICLVIAYACLAFVQIWGDNLEIRFCIVIAFMIQFSFVACFFWLNVLCFHTWKKMTKKHIRKLKKCQYKNKLFLFYSLYGWGFPIIILGITLIMDLMPTIPASYIKPNFGIDACWFQNNDATLSYFYGPISVLLAINVIFFVLTIKYLHINSSEQTMNHFSEVAARVIINRRRQIFVQSLMLFCVMGLNWILEVLSWTVSEPPQLWIVIDTFNTLQGVIIFLVFVLRDEKVRRLAWEKISFWKKNDSPGEHNVPLNSVAVQ